MRRAFTWFTRLVWLLALGPVAVADEPPVPVSVPQAADGALAAARAGDVEALGGLAGREAPDPWLVADELVRRGEVDAALSFASAAPRADVASLPAYVASRREASEEPGARARLGDALAALEGGDPERALEALGPPAAGDPEDIVGVRTAWTRGLALKAARRMGEAYAACRAAAEAAEHLGWLSLAFEAWHAAGSTAFSGVGVAPARASFERRLAVAERRGASGDVAATLVSLATILRRAGAYPEAIAALERALLLYESLGDPLGLGRALRVLGTVHDARGDGAQALVFLQRALKVAEEAGDELGKADALGNIGLVHYDRGEYAQALELYARSLALKEARGDLAGASATLNNMALVHHARGDYDQALAAFERSVAIDESLGDRAGEAATLGNVGTIHLARGDARRALETFERVRALHEELGNRRGVADAVSNAAGAHFSLGEYPEAKAGYERAIALNEALGDRRRIAGATSNLGLVLHALDDYAGALALHERALALQQELGDRAGIARTLGRIGDVQRSLGQLATALATELRVLEMKRDLGDRDGVSQTLGAIGNVHFQMGQFAQAITFYEQSRSAGLELGDKAWAASMLSNVGNVYFSLGDHARAISVLERALAEKDALGDRRGVAAALVNMGSAKSASGDLEGAMALYERAMHEFEALGDRAAVAATLVNLSGLRKSRGEHDEAIALGQRALEVYELLGSPAGVAAALGNLGSAYDGKGDRERALAFFERALARFEEAGDRSGIAVTLLNLASVHEGTGETSQALALARRAVEVSTRIVEQLAEEEGARARDQYVRAFDVGERAAAKLDRPDELSWFLEQGRAGGLRAVLGSREAFEAVAVPPALRADLTGARAEERRALAAYRRAAGSQDETVVGGARRGLEEAQARVAEVEARIRREARVAAAITLGDVDDLDATRARLRSDEALVAYALAGDAALALVVTASGARIVDLGASAPIAHAARVLAAALQDRTSSVRGAQLAEETSSERGDAGAVDLLARLVVAPLALPEDVRRVLVSPAGALGYVPFALLLPEREVAYVPSGTTYGLLRAERERRGEGVLALGDPDYGRVGDEVVAARHRGGIALRLSRLEATRPEAEAVGTLRLLGEDATEAGLRSALETSERWRAVHFACHGLLDPEQPMFSSLALTAAGEDDGFLTALEILQLPMHADLVVMSACETGKGKVYKIEGIVGLTQALMFAGAPRVVCSLWKVDDVATRTLMVRFYELWNPKEGTGLAPAAALREAQRFVRESPAHPEWRHPFYWAAWVLWGLPD